MLHYPRPSTLRVLPRRRAELNWWGGRAASWMPVHDSPSLFLLAGQALTKLVNPTALPGSWRKRRWRRWWRWPLSGNTGIDKIYHSHKCGHGNQSCNEFHIPVPSMRVISTGPHPRSCFAPIIMTHPCGISHGYALWWRRRVLPPRIECVLC